EINKDDIEKKMQAYATNYNELKKIRDEIFSFENLVKYSITEGEQDTVTLVVEAENILDKPMEADVKYYLPEEITSEYILDSGGLEVNYDPDRAQFFLSKDEKFKAQEKKRYNVSIKKIWAIGEKDLEMYLTEAEELNQKIKGSDSEMIGQALYDEIVANVEKIKKSQNQAKTVKEYIAAYRKNLRDEEQIKDDLEKLKILAVESQSDAVNRQVNQAFQKMDNITTIKMKDIAQKLIQKIKKIGVWRIIFVMVIFLISLTTFFYTIWFLRLRKEEKTEIKDIGKQE
ncbi:MAG: hypothetical protein PHZ27_05015, partial [Candidatus Omnitrophica bacterium]|nr:hypothetical protein [Candidatus Omnitrophota bacterium]